MHWRRASLGLALVPIAAAALFFRLPGESAAIPRVEVALAALPARAPQRLAAPGFVEPVSEVYSITASAPGRIVALKAEEGDQVAAGEVIAEIESDDLRAQRAIAEATVAMRQAELAKLRAGAREQERADAAAALHEAEAKASLAKLEAERESKLIASGAVSQATYDRARADFAAADAHRAQLAERLSLIEAPPRAEDVAIAEARVADAKAQIEQTQALIDKTLIRSPIDGVLLRRFSHVGEMMSVQPLTMIAEIGDISRLRVRAQIDEADVGQIEVGQEATITADAYPGRQLHGRVARIGAIMGEKRFRTDRPGERMDTKVLEALVDLDPGVSMPVNLRVDVLFDTPSPEQTSAATSPQQSSEAAAPSPLPATEAAAQATPAASAQAANAVPLAGPDQAALPDAATTAAAQSLSVGARMPRQTAETPPIASGASSSEPDIAEKASGTPAAVAVSTEPAVPELDQENADQGIASPASISPTAGP